MTDTSDILVTRNGILMGVIDIESGSDKLIYFLVIEGVFEDMVSGELFLYGDK